MRIIYANQKRTREEIEDSFFNLMKVSRAKLAYCSGVGGLFSEGEYRLRDSSVRLRFYLGNEFIRVWPIGSSGLKRKGLNDLLRII